MRPEQLVALKNVCCSQEEIQTVFNNPAVFNFSSKFKAYVTLCVAKEGDDKYVWTACVRLANQAKRNFKSSALWTIQEKIKARNILLDQLDGVGAELGQEEFNSRKGMHFNKLLTPEEKWVVLRPAVLGN